jgi:hypothetical protein
MEQEMCIKISLMPMKELLIKLTIDPEFQPSLLIFDLMTLDNPAIKIFETSMTIATLSMLGGKQIRPTMAVMAFKDSDPELIRGILNTDIKSIVPCANWMGYEGVTRAFQALLEGKKHMPCAWLVMI